MNKLVQSETTAANCTVLGVWERPRFEVRDSDGRVVEAPEFGDCSMKARRLTLGPREVMTRTATWRVGDATRPGAPGATGLVTIHGRLGFIDARPRPGTPASVRVQP